jgi:hypothetical protein
MFIGTGTWFTAGMLQRDWPLASGELISLILYFLGIIAYGINMLL